LSAKADSLKVWLDKKRRYGGGYNAFSENQCHWCWWTIDEMKLYVRISENRQAAMMLIGY